VSAARVPALTPQGHLVLAPASPQDAQALPGNLQARVEVTFALGVGHALLDLGIREVGTALPPDFGYWRDFAGQFVTALCTSMEPLTAEHPTDINVVATPTSTVLADLLSAAPPMAGGEYLTAEVLRTLWHKIDAAYRVERSHAKQSLQEFLTERNPAWHLVGRVHFNLAENRSDEEAPFAFIVTYTTRLSARGSAQHLPLAEALREYAGAKNKVRLLSLLKPVQEGAAQCAWLHAMVESGEIYHPLRWTAAEAFQLLTDVPKLEGAGIVVRTPSAWKIGRPLRPKITAIVGGRVPSVLGSDALLDFQVELTLGDERLTAAEIRTLLNGSDGLQFLRGRWVEVDRAKLTQLLERFREIEAAASAGGLPFGAAMRLVAGVKLEEESVEAQDPDWSTVSAGPWLAETLKDLRSPEGLAHIDPGTALQATLRPYQQAGVRWLYLLHRLGLGACLADDMGLGKTIQVLALLLVLKQENTPRTGEQRLIPNLLVAPASLLGNWAAEVERFAPTLRILIAHPSMMNPAGLKELTPEALADVDLVITSYGALLRYPWLSSTPWRIAVIDEAQAIKNPSTKQTRAVKKLIASTRIALTGTPVENQLSDLWSIFDFTHPGLLGSSQAFGRYVRRLAEARSYASLRELVRPYILRRMKTDKAVIADLPEKTEMKAFCHLSPAQAVLYQQAVAELAAALNGAEGMGRKGLVLAFLMRFKQICNHSSQWLGDGAWAEAGSGKFARLRELAEVIAAKQEKMLVFTQFREATQPLAAFLGSVFGREGLVLHGGTPVGNRKELVRQFQEDELTPFFVLSLKAGGAGLNLTAASHVVHFDRWWNPAVENQATDRAFRIGQSRNVLVHKFVCRGTVEDKIDQLIESKQTLVRDVLEGGAELQLTELADRELLNLVALDIHSAQADA
jgi:SNF2-related domain/SNF2 Helicase protein/Helicase conserved C-terminal domain